MDANIAHPAGDTVPRQWYETQREALHRQEMRNVVLLARITELHREIERLQKRGGGAGGAGGAGPETTPTRERIAAPIRTKAIASTKAAPTIVDLTI